MGKRTPDGLTVVPTPWRDVLLLCRKCSRKLDGGFGEDGGQALRRTLREALRGRGRRRDVRVMEVGCLGVCPKGAVTTASGSSPGELLVVPRGTDAGAVLDRLLPTREGQGGPGASAPSPIVRLP